LDPAQAAVADRIAASVAAQMVVFFMFPPAAGQRKSGATREIKDLRRGGPRFLVSS
jgi:hypothetical protein